MMRPALVASLVLAILVTSSQAADPPKLELKNGDRIVYLGNTFVERDAAYGYLETMLTIRHPDINFTFRNLGWSGDTVWGDARARFGTRADGFKHLKEDVFALKPTVILVAYGMNESFAGEAGLKEFEAGLNTLLDTLAETKAKIVLISPIPHENLGPPLPDPAKHNEDIALYRDAMSKIATSRSVTFLDRFGKGRYPYPKGIGWRFTDDGIQPSSRGSAYQATRMIAAVDGKGEGSPERLLKLKPDGSHTSMGWDITNLKKIRNGVTFDAIAPRLPDPRWPVVPMLNGGWTTGGGGFTLQALGLERGEIDHEYGLNMSGHSVCWLHHTSSDASLATVVTGPEIDQVEKLRALINKKNELHFNRWRPENETYLFLFRKHEQGNNAVEIPQFDPLIEKLEAEINELKKPVKHTYEIVREEVGK